MSAQDEYHLYLLGWKDGAMRMSVRHGMARHRAYVNGHQDGGNAIESAVAKARQDVVIPNNVDPATLDDLNQMLK